MAHTFQKCGSRPPKAWGRVMGAAAGGVAAGGRVGLFFSGSEACVPSSGLWTATEGLSSEERRLVWCYRRSMSWQCGEWGSLGKLLGAERPIRRHFAIIQIKYDEGLN